MARKKKKEIEVKDIKKDNVEDIIENDLEVLDADSQEEDEKALLREKIMEYERKGYISKLGSMFRSVIDEYNLVFGDRESLVNFFENTEKGKMLKRKSLHVNKHRRFFF